MNKHKEPFLTFHRVRIPQFMGIRRYRGYLLFLSGLLDDFSGKNSQILKPIFLASEQERV